MSLSAENIRDIRNSWNLLAEDAEGMTSTFYAELFRIAPEVRPMFSDANLKAQGKKLAGAIGLVVRHADNLGPVLAPLREMGARHADYGVTDEHYDVVAQALIATMTECLGDKFTEETRNAWVAAYTAVAATMQAGAADLRRKTA